MSKTSLITFVSAALAIWVFFLYRGDTAFLSRIVYAGIAFVSFWLLLGIGVWTSIWLYRSLRN